MEKKKKALAPFATTDLSFPRSRLGLDSSVNNNNKKQRLAHATAGETQREGK